VTRSCQHAGVVGRVVATGTVYSEGPGVDNYHFSSHIIMSYNTLYTPLLDLVISLIPSSFRDAHICVNTHGWEVLFLLGLFLYSSNNTYSISSIAIGCHEQCSQVMVICSLPSTSAISPHSTEYPRTVDATMKHLPSTKEVS